MTGNASTRSVGMSAANEPKSPTPMGGASVSEVLKAPRLQLRWVRDDGPSAFSFNGEPDWLCHYELVLPLREFDCRREIYDADGEEIGEQSELIVPIKGPTRRGSNGKAPCDWAGFDTPYRDGAHAGWDSQVLGGVPIYVIAPDGTAHPEPDDKRAARQASNPTAEGV